MAMEKVRPHYNEKRSSICFMDLPPVVRRSVYIAAGLVRVCPISLNTEGAYAQRAEYLEENKDWWLFDEGNRFVDMEQLSAMRCYYRHKRFYKMAINASSHGIDCLCIPLPSALLRVSRTIYNEVLPILYSENQFRIYRTYYGGLSSLLMLNPATLHFITSISIQLNNCSCIPNHQCPDQLGVETCCPECHATCRIGRDLPFSLEQSDSLAVISEWKRVTARLALNICPGKLKLSVVCDTIDYATAKQITKPLLELPHLSEFSIRLGQLPDASVKNLAQDVVYQLTAQAEHNPRPFFNFSALPAEVQTQILAYTDLVSLDSITWIHKTNLEFISCCLQCTSTLETCCCPPLHAAYTSMACCCWVMPSALFLVSRKVRDQALEIFFSRNRFEIWPERREDEPRLQPDSTHVLEFLQALPAVALRYIRSLHIKVRLLEYQVVGPGTEFQSNWNTTIDFISRNLEIPQLCLSIQDVGGRAMRISYYTTGYTDAESAEDDEFEWQLYQHLAAPLAVLKGLRDFAIRFSRSGSFGRFHAERERILERRVLGDAYHDAVRAKEKAREEGRVVEEETPVYGPDGTQIWPLWPRPPWLADYDLQIPC